MTTFVISCTDAGRPLTTHVTSAKDAIAAREALRRTCPNVQVTRDGRTIGEMELAQAASVEEAARLEADRQFRQDYEDREWRKRNAERLAAVAPPNTTITRASAPDEGGATITRIG